ncbi:ABC transporter ATP-binding protein [Microbispora rosea subsp. aerata]|nr:ABC transporter ATP-binding protein [Microbispora rosea subsp. aerata]GIH57129.1 ABC transporter ATP-binding protein [Microbispora rosea subsp. aerata]GLJ84801.1 ABC transporter ATP-binding protein [Microbispora rosea subsp. aerata]
MTGERMTGNRASSAPLLQVKDAAVHFGGVKAVDGLSIELTEGKIFGILGPNGSGKSTLLAAITRFVDLTAGEILLDGEEYHTLPAARVARRGVARTFQTVRLLPGLTVEENIRLGADRVGGRGGADGVREAIERTGLKGLERHRPGELSYGVQRRVEIARAIVARPRLLLLDEPTAGMNQSERQEVSALMRELQKEGLTQLIVEHDVQMMVDTCDHLFAMNFGKLIAQGDPAGVVREPAVREAYLGKRWSQHV